jgi:adenylate cyclase
MPFIAELKRRNVFRVGVAYAIVAWLLVEVASVVLPTFEAPEWVMKVFTFLLILGFPVALVFAWAFELTPAGIQLEKTVDRGESIKQQTGRKLDFAIIGLLVIAVIYFALDKFVLEQAEVTADSVLMAESVAREESIAVLPFANMSPDPDNEYFSDGISEEILNVLAQVPGLRVASRTSAFTFKGDNRNMGEIAETLNVRHVLEGSVRKSGNRVRIAAQLIDASNEKHLWSETYDRELIDIFAIQSEIARAVARKIKIELNPDKEALLTNTRTVEPEAHEAYLRGQYEAAKFTADSFTKAAQHYQKALVADPKYAPAYAGLADAYFSLGQPMSALPNHEAMPKAKEAARKALELDPLLAKAYTALGVVIWIYDWDWAAADQLLRRAIELNPNSAYARRLYGIYLSAMGRHGEAIAQGALATELNPLSLRTRSAHAESYLMARDYGRAIELYQQLIEIEPSFHRAYAVLNWIYETLREYDQSIEVFQVAENLTAEETMSLRAAYTDMGSEGYWRWMVEWYEAKRSKGYVPLSTLARVYARSGDPDAAFEILEEAFEARDGDLAFMNAFPDWDPLRSDPRFDDLLRRMNFPGS